MSKKSEQLTKEQADFFANLLNDFINEFLGYHKHVSNILGLDSKRCTMRGDFKNAETNEEYELEISITKK